MQKYEVTVPQAPSEEVLQDPNMLLRSKCERILITYDPGRAVGGYFIIASKTWVLFHGYSPAGFIAGMELLAPAMGFELPDFDKAAWYAAPAGESIN